MVTAPARAEAQGGQAANLALLGVLTLFWGLNWPAMKLVVTELPVATFRTLGLFFAGIALLAIARVGGERLGVPRRARGPLLVAAFFNMFAWSALTAIGLQRVEAGRAGILAYTMPVWAAILARIVLGERLSPRRLLGLVFGMAGVASLLLPDMARLGAAPVGSIIVLLAAVTWAIGTIYTKRVEWGMSMAQLTGWQLLLAGIPFAIAAVVLDPPDAVLHLSGRGAAALLYSLTLPMVLCNWIWMVLLDRLPASVAGLSTLAIPVVGVLSGAVILGERIGPVEGSALVLVVTALALVLAPERRA